MTTGERSGNFVTGGTVPLESRAYVPRPFEDELFETVTAGRWAVLVGPRQHGKSSALARLYVRLQRDGFSCAIVDLQAYGADETYDQFLAWLCERIAREVGSEVVSPEITDDLEAWLRAVLPDEYPNVVILLDEISAVPSSLQKRFFGQLRALFNARGLAEKDDLPWRVTFVFAGTFRHEAMVDSENSPFNVSRFINSTDLSTEHVLDLARVADGEAAERWAERTFELVGGQPYLVQVLLAAALRAADSPEAGFERAATALRDGSDRHLPALIRRIGGDPALQDLTQRLLPGPINFNGTDDDHLYAIVVGVARVEDGQLVIRNALYREALEISFRSGDETERVEAPGAQPPPCDVLLVAVTAIEAAAVRDVFGVPDETADFFAGTNAYTALGRFGDADVVLTRPQAMGTIGPGAAPLAVTEGIQYLHPGAVIMVGIAFGVDPEHQEIGDVLVARQVVGYESSRVSTQASGEQQVLSRAARVDASSRLIARLQAAEAHTSDPIAFVPMLSGEKLVDNIDFRDQLREIASDAKGGEMEAIGVYSAAAREGTHWIIVKGICDFADGQKRENETFHQRHAAERAAQFVRLAIEGGGFSA
jgi:nucleoside phosphorylase